MRIVSRKNLRAYAAKHPNTRPALRYWELVASRATWRSPDDVLKTFPKASIISGERIRFEIEWNTHRMVCAFYFPSQSVFIKFLGTHKKYDQITDIRTVSMFAKREVRS